VRHLYVHIPFCVRRCSYCDFSIAVRKRIPAGEYVDCVRRELQLLRATPSPLDSGWVNPGTMPRGSADTKEAPSSQLTGSAAGLGALPAAQDAGFDTQASESDAILETLYLGGGTPSLLGADALKVLLGSLLDSASSPSKRDGVEITLEANPEDVSPVAARAWRDAGVNRVSLGAQSFDDRILQWMHRSHDAARITEALRTLRAVGIDNVSLDLIFALPVELRRDWSRDLDAALSLLPSHLSLYGLTVEARTPLARWISRGGSSAPDDERYAEEYLVAHERLSAAGYHFYEVSNACRDDLRSRHNSAYWCGRDYIGLGPAAHSFDGRTRRWNVAQWEDYRRAIAAGRTAVESHELLTPEQRELERWYLALRTDAGLATSACPPARLPAWAGQGWVEVTGDRVCCTPEGWLRLDALVRDLTGVVETV
jgi:putative oxygen-independent coproporphyrinogen III oxidase